MACHHEGEQVNKSCGLGTLTPGINANPSPAPPPIAPITVGIEGGLPPPAAPPSPMAISPVPGTKIPSSILAESGVPAGTVKSGIGWPARAACICASLGSGTPKANALVHESATAALTAEMILSPHWVTNK